jgi:hypothetical protein
MASDEAAPDLLFAISRDETTSVISIAQPGEPTISTSEIGQFLYELEGAANIACQLRRRDLFFLHAAVAEVSGRAHLFVAESGGGKSTTLWGLLHHGWSYMSDELAPIDLTTMHVDAYPRALCLKRRPPQPYPLPAETIETSWTLHVSTRDLPRVSPMNSCPLAAVYFLRYCPDASHPQIGPISVGEASARLYANTLNPLAHANAGLDAATQIAKNVSSFALHSADLAETCALVCSHASSFIGD